MSSNCSYGEHSSSDDRGYHSERWLGEEHRGFLDICKCGESMYLVQEESPAHKGRLYYKCSKYTDADEHCSKWFDEAVEDEIRCLKTITKSHTDRLYRLNERLNASVEPFSSRFSDEVTKLNIVIGQLQRELELVDKKYAEVCQVTGYYESQRGWLKYAYARAGSTASAGVKAASRAVTNPPRKTITVFLVGAAIAMLYAVYQNFNGACT